MNGAEITGVRPRRACPVRSRGFSAGPAARPYARSGTIHGGRAGTTLAELLVALALLAVIVPVLSRAWQAGRDLESRATRDAVALTLAENRWALLRTGNLDTLPVADAPLDDPWSEYRWSLALEPSDFDGAQLGIVTIAYAWRNTERTLSLTGLLITEATP